MNVSRETKGGIFMRLSDILLTSHKVSEYCDDEVDGCYCKYSNNIIVDYKRMVFCKSSAPLWYVISNTTMFDWTKLNKED